MSSPFAHVAVVGGGLIGGSVAAASRRSVERVTVVDPDPQVASITAERGLADRVVGRIGPEIADADLVVIAVPVYEIARVAAATLAAVPRAVVTDVGSVKQRIVHDVASAGSDAERFVGGHPMAGSERQGPGAADPELFHGATWALTPTADTRPDAFDGVARHVRSLGARVLAVAPDLHDRLVAVSSHLPQLVATTLMTHTAEMAESAGEAVLALTGRGFRDVTRIAGSDAGLWTGILRENAAAVADRLTAFTSELLELRDAVLADDWNRVAGAIAAGAAARRRLPDKSRASRLVDLVVPMDDRPGMLAVVTTTLGEAGINVEDLAMRHAEELPRGALLVGVEAGVAAERAQALLAQRGYSSHVEPR